MKKLLMTICCLISLKPLLYGEIKNPETKDGAFLEAKIEFIPTQPVKGSEIIQPGTPIIISAELTNSGNKSSEIGYFYVRFSYPNPLASQPKSQLFATEKILLPSIPPGKKAITEFKTTHKTPSLYDYIRQDYGMRQYQAIAVIDSKEYVIGNASLTFSAYYYAGPNHEVPTQVPSALNSQPTPQTVPVQPMQVEAVPAQAN